MGSLDSRIRTKIVCTMGPAVNEIGKIKDLLDAGMNVARLNFSHGTLPEHERTLALLRQAREEKGIPLAVMLDTKGPEIRLGVVPEGKREVEAGDRVVLLKREGSLGIMMTPESIFSGLQVGMRILFDNGYIGGRVVALVPEGVEVEIENSGILQTHKGVNIPNLGVFLPAMTEEDKEAIAFGCKHGVDWIAASFIRSPENIIEIKNYLEKLGRSDISVIAKIEDPEGVRRFDEILTVADGIMVARGDLGVELPVYRVPSLQKMMIEKCISAAKPVITATQMLESMIRNPRPTRAEVSDVANAIYDGSSAVMLSGETAVGFYPCSAVAMMRDTVIEAEKQFPYEEFFYRNLPKDSQKISVAVASAAVKTGYEIGAKAIFLFTRDRLVADVMGKCKPRMPVFALCVTEEEYRRSALLWGIIPVFVPDISGLAEGFAKMIDFAKSVGVIRSQDRVLTIASDPFEAGIEANQIQVDIVKD